MNNSKYFPDEIDYHESEKQRQRAVDFVNRTYNSKPGISPGLQRLLIGAFLVIGVAVLIKWVG